MALYVWGGNAAKQLGLDISDREIYDVRQVTALEGQTVVDFSGGVSHSVAVNEFGEVFSWGRGREGQLGLGTREDYVVRVPERVAALDGHIIKKVSCGDTHTIYLSVTGEVFMTGLLPETREVKNDGMFDHASVSLTGLQSSEADRYNTTDVIQRLMRGSEEIYETQHVTKHDLDDTETSLSYLQSKKIQTVRHTCFTPRLATSLLRHKITNIAAGFAHSLAVSAEGVAFSCGYNDNGQLGIGSRRNSADFTRVRNLEGFFITQIACGQQHSLGCSRIDPLDPAKSGVCFSWGLGILGQLGLGINISWLPMEVNVGKPVISIAAGSHHSVAVTDDNKVYSWGHSEYGQHGAGERSQDLQRGLYYFFPRLQESLESQEITVEKVSCSTHSTFALAKDGSVYSWGWNAFGILGNGKYQHSVHPQKVTGLKDNVATHVSAGANHCAVVVRPRGCHYSLKYDQVLKYGAFHDLEFVVGGQATPTNLTAHQVIVCARSNYLRGLLRVLRPTVTTKRCEGREVLVVDEFRDVDVQVFRAYLLYLYTNRLDIVSHKRKALKDFAERVCEDALAADCQVTWRKQRPATGTIDDSELADRRQFEDDMQTIVLSEEFADVEFLWPKEEGGYPDEETKQNEEFERLPAHKAVLSQVDYFHTMFSGGFSEGRAYEESKNNSVEDGVHQIALHHMPQDGISLNSFKALLAWIYTGSISSLRRLEPTEMMDLYVAASLIGLTVLAAQCEMLVIDLLPSIEQDEASLQACLDFASQFDARRLKSLSQRALKLWHGVETDENEAVAELAKLELYGIAGDGAPCSSLGLGREAERRDLHDCAHEEADERAGQVAPPRARQLVLAVLVAELGDGRAVRVVAEEVADAPRDHVAADPARGRRDAHGLRLEREEPRAQAEHDQQHVEHDVRVARRDEVAEGREARERRDEPRRDADADDVAVVHAEHEQAADDAAQEEERPRHDAAPVHVLEHLGEDRGRGERAIKERAAERRVPQHAVAGEAEQRAEDERHAGRDERRDLDVAHAAVALGRREEQVHVHAVVAVAAVGRVRRLHDARCCECE